MDAVVRATYEFETALDPEPVARAFANEQSSGTFVRVARESDELRAAFAARVVALDELPLSGHTPLPGYRGDWANATRWRAVLEFPLHNFGPSLPNLLAAVAGNLFDMRDVGALKLMDLDLPAEFAGRYPGPAFGVDGTRRLMGRPAGVLLGTIIKPSIGLAVAELADLVAELATAGIDFIKDDELQGNSPAAPLADRVAAVMPVLHAHADRAGRLPMYAFNITDDLDAMAAHCEVVQKAGGTAVMACINTVGFAGIEFLRRRCSLPIHAHRTMFGAFSRSPQVGFHFGALQKLARLAGADHIHTNGIHNKFYESDAEVLASIRAVRAPFLGGYQALPVLSSGQWAGLAEETYAATGTADLLVMAGGGIHGHPDGSAAGVESMRQAWDAAESGEPLAQRAAAVPALARALDAFGGRRG